MWYGSSRATARRLTWFCPGSFVDLNLNQTRVYRDGGESVCGKSLKTVCVAYDVIFCMFYSEDQAKKKKKISVFIQVSQDDEHERWRKINVHNYWIYPTGIN